MNETEGLSARTVINELYGGLLERYNRLGFTDDDFYKNFVEEGALLRRVTKTLSGETPPLFQDIHKWFCE
jgi:hypothetical protein